MLCVTYLVSFSHIFIDRRAVLSADKNSTPSGVEHKTRESISMVV